MAVKSAKFRMSKSPLNWVSVAWVMSGARVFSKLPQRLPVAATTGTAPFSHEARTSASTMSGSP